MHTRLLEGLRVVDLSMGWAGPLAARHLADMGAEVIKVEGCVRFDWWRSWEATPEWIADDGAEKAIPYIYVNRNKLDITLDLDDQRGKDLLLRLVARSDVVVENFSGGVLPKLGLDYAAMKAANEQIVMISMPAFGSGGPWGEFRAYGSTVEQASGLPHLNGRAEDPPTMQHVAFGDSIGGLNGAAALVTALLARQRTGTGQFIDLSQAECLFPLAAHGILQQAVTGEPPPRVGNDHPAFAPHGVYPCAGHDRWILIQVFDEAGWQALAGVTGLQFGNLEDRLERRRELDASLAAWTSTRDDKVLMHELQAAGVTAAALHDALDVVDDPHLVERGYLQWQERAFVGCVAHPSAAYRNDDEPLPVRTVAPTLGQHNRQVLGGLLGVSDPDLEDLAAAGVIGTKPRMRDA